MKIFFKNVCLVFLLLKMFLFYYFKDVRVLNIVKILILINDKIYYILKI